MGTSVQTKSQEIFEKSCEVIAGGVNSPVRAFIGLEVDPLIVERGEGDTIYDVDGKVYVDYCMSWGALVLGHADPEVVEEAKKRIELGSSFGIATSIEEELARFIVKAIPSIEKLRFVSSGTEATMAAVRVARGYTGRSLVIKFNGNYHGHSDPFLVKAGSGASQLSQESSSKGVPEEIVKHTISLPYNDTEAFCQLMRDPFHAPLIAAVILEPIAANMGVVSASLEFLRAVRDETERNGSLLIFDEVISGFRVGLEGAQGLFGIQPDLTCLGKIVGGGFPAAAFGGNQDIMDVLAPTGGVYQAGTLSGNPVAMQAGLTTLRRAMQAGFYEDLEEKTRVITEPVREALKRKDLPACVQQVRGMFTLFWGPQIVRSFEDLQDLDTGRFHQFFCFLLKRGVYFSPSPYEACFISSAHTENNLRRTRDLILEFIRQC